MVRDVSIVAFMNELLVAHENAHPQYESAPLKEGSSSEVGPLHRASGSLTEGHGRREAERSEAAKAIVAADGVGDHESQLS